MSIIDLKSLLALLTPSQRKGGLVLLGLTLIGVVLETLGVGAIIPAITLVTNPDIAQAHPWARAVVAFLGDPEPQRLVVLVMGCLAGVYFLKLSFLAALAWWEARYTSSLQEHFADRFFSIYLHQPYAFHLNKNSSELVRNITSESGAAVTYVITPCLKLFAEGMIVVALAGLLIAVEPIGALASLVTLGAASWAFQWFTRGRVSAWGLVRQKHEGECLLHLQQGLGGIKDAKMFASEDVLAALYRRHNHERLKVVRYQSTLQQLPRLWIEWLAVSGLALLVSAMMAQSKDPSQTLPVVAVFAAAAFRLMPSLNRILMALNSIRFGIPTIKTLRSELALSESIPSQQDHALALPFRRELICEAVSFTYHGASEKNLKRVNLVLRRGESIGIVGPSGAGKSTLLDVLLGLLQPTEGRVLVDGFDIQHAVRAWQSQIGYVPQSIFLTDDSIRNNIAFGVPRSEIDEASILASINAAQLGGLVAELEDGLDTVVGERGVRLSGGQRQRLGIARALYRNPDVLVLDEATSALDAETEREFMKCVQELGRTKTVIVVAHRLATVASCDRVYRLEKGAITSEGPPGVVLDFAQEKGVSGV